jgi:CrcB protein
MNQIFVIAIGGAFGAVMRFMISTGVYHWLGRGFPYGTLVVNLLGSFLIGLLTEALLLQRIALTIEYRSAILVGLFGSLTTFSTFSLETLYLLEQGSLQKAALNIVISVCACVFAAWVGLWVGRGLFMYSGGVVRGLDWMFPYALIIVNVIIAFLIGLMCAAILDKLVLAIEYRAAIVIFAAGAFVTLSSLYVVLYLIEHGHSFDAEFNTMISVLLGNGLLCLSTLWVGIWVGKHI